MLTLMRIKIPTSYLVFEITLHNVSSHAMHDFSKEGCITTVRYDACNSNGDKKKKNHIWLDHQIRRLTRSHRQSFSAYVFNTVKLKMSSYGCSVLHNGTHLPTHEQFEHLLQTTTAYEEFRATLPQQSRGKLGAVLLSVILCGSPFPGHFRLGHLHLCNFSI